MPLIVYFDKSAIVPIIIEKPSSLAVARLWDEVDRVVSSGLVYAEGRGALAMAHRLHRVDDDELRASVEDFESHYEQLDIVEITDGFVREAGSLAEQFALRCYDAVHLASAQLVHDLDMVLATGDQNLVKAAQALGFATSNP